MAHAQPTKSPDQPQRRQGASGPQRLLWVASALLAACLPRVDVGSGTPAPDASVEPLRGAGGTGGTGSNDRDVDASPGSDPGVVPPLVEAPTGSGGSGSAPDVPLQDAGVAENTPSAPLTLVAAEPAGSAFEVAIDTPLSLTFSAPLDPESVSGLSIELSRPGSIPVTGAITVDGARLTFVPSEPLVLDNSYVWRYVGSVRGVDGARWDGSAEASFRTVFGHWGAPEYLSTAGSQPRIAFDDAGNALAIWNQPGASPQTSAAGVGVARFTPAGGWQVLPSSNFCGPECDIKLVAGGKGGVFEIAWASEGYLLAQRYQPDEGFSEAAQVSDRGASPQGTDGAVSNDGLWLATNLSFGIGVSHLPSQGAWQQSNAYISDARQGTAGPVLVADGPERARVFWLESSQLLASTYLDGGWSAPQLVPNPRGDFTAAGLSGSGIASGNALLAWEEDRPLASDASLIESILNVVMMGPDGAVLEEKRPELPEGIVGNASSPSVSMNANGEALLTWLQNTGDPNDPAAPATAWGSFHSPADPTWSSTFQLSVTTDGVARPPAVAIDPSGNGHAVWVTDDPNGDTRVLASRYLAEGRLFGGHTPLSEGAPVSSGLTRGPRSGNDHLQLAVDAQGRALAIWDGTQGAIWTARFE